MRLSPWGRVGAISALLVVGGAVALATTRNRDVDFPVNGTLEGLSFDLAGGNIEIVGGAEAVKVSRREHYAFGHFANTDKTVSGTTLRVRSRCPRPLLGPCSVDYRVTVPDNVGLEIHTTAGHVALRGYRGSAKVTTGSGTIEIAGYCGNSLDARAGSGAITVQAVCAPPRMSLRTSSGAVSAEVPAGRYDLDAETNAGDATVRGITARDDAPYSVQVLSGSGDVTVEGRS
jgi:hypothetical protein